MDEARRDGTLPPALAGGVLDALSAEIAVLDGDGVVVATNDAWRRHHGAEVGTLFVDELVGAVDDDIEALLRMSLQRVLGGRSPHVELEVPLDGPEGRRWKLLLLDGVAELGEVGGVITRVDVTRSHEVLDIVSETALHDSLTRLPNRSLLEDRISTAVARRERGQSAPVVLFLDLDRFKEINDQYGHEAGDRVLATIGRRLSSSLRASDSCGRWGGDEFVAVVEVNPRDDHAALDGVIDRICDTLNAPVELEGTQLEVGVSIGAVFVQPDDTPAALVALADAAMYEAKRAGLHAAVAERDVVDVRLDVKPEC